MGDPQVMTFRPAAEQYAWTFGGAPPVARIRPGTMLELWTEDCFAGRVRGQDDLVSQVCEFPFLNPQTGPFYVEGAEPGDTLAVHFVSIEPARDWAASTTVPLFGALTSTHLTATLQDPLPELVWIWELDRAGRLCRFTARDSDFTADLPMSPMHGTVGVAPANLEVRSALVPDAFGGNMDTPEMRSGVTPARARARPAGLRSSARWTRCLRSTCSRGSRHRGRDWNLIRTSCRPGRCGR
jgi:acetamidase/formamidase